MKKITGDRDIKLNTQYFTILLLFVVGAMNSIDYLNFMGLGILSTLLTYSLYLLLIITATLLIMELMLGSKTISLNFLSYWIILIIGIMFKLMILFLQFPTSMLPGGFNFGFMMDFLCIMIIMTVTINSLQDFKFIKLSIWSLGLGLLISSIIPLFLYPDMIGRRESLVNGYEFSGGFWNPGVIAFLSVGWLLIALSINEKSKLKRIILFCMFILFALSGLSGLSRALFLSIVISIVVYLVVANKIKQYLRFILLGATVSVIFLYGFNDIIENLLLRFDGGINIEEEARVNIWKAYLINIPDFIWFGEITGDYKKYTQWTFGPHSAPLNWFVQFGLLGLVGFMMLILGLIKSSRIISKSNIKITKAALFAWLFAYVSISFINETGFKDLSLFGGIAIIYAWAINSYKQLNIKNQ